MKKVLIVAAAAVLGACGGGGGDGAGAAPATVTPPAPCSVPVIQLFGDSTQAGQGDNLQRYMDSRFGVGKVLVQNLGVPGTTAQDMAAAQVKAGALTVSNYGINDFSRPIALEAFKAALRFNKTSVLETPSPPYDGYAQAVREVAAELNRPVIDVSAWVRAQPGWESHVPDGVHPDAWLYQQITEKLVGPEMADAISPKVCK